MLTQNPPEERKVLVVQCCHLPHFFYTARKLQERNPGWRVEALVLGHPQVRLYLEEMGSFVQVHFFPQDLAALKSGYDRVVFPLLAAGYRRIRLGAWSLGATRWASDYEANLEPLSRWQLWISCLKPRYPPTTAFLDYQAGFPYRLGGSRVLIVESCPASLIAKTEPLWSALLHPRIPRERLSPGTFRETWKAARRHRYDAAVVFFSGEPGFRFLKLLPFLLRIRTILVVNENGHYFQAGPRSLLRFLYWRIRRGIPPPSREPRPQRVLLWQTESDEMTLQALERLQDPKIVAGARVSVFCRVDKKQLFESAPGVEAVYTYRPGALFYNLASLARVARSYPHVSTAIFSRRRVYMPHKLLFFAVPARHHLVFNQNLDCFYLSRQNFHQLVDPEWHRFSPWSVAFRSALKAFLFLPRFFYLVAWFTFRKLKARYAGHESV